MTSHCYVYEDWYWILIRRCAVYLHISHIMFHCGGHWWSCERPVVLNQAIRSKLLDTSFRGMSKHRASDFIKVRTFVYLLAILLDSFLRSLHNLCFANSLAGLLWNYTRRLSCSLNAPPIADSAKKSNFSSDTILPLVDFSIVSIANLAQ